ncbi:MULTISPECIES: sensor histidine kinase [Actinosynnema]|uniref:sensor histidine kinase n=1 Tax=Actinosynnema TaxID=40566 RepID=UPI0020A311EF|nr:histidine kinase [Actinosynnema pretiosum]
MTTSPRWRAAYDVAIVLVVLYLAFPGGTGFDWALGSTMAVALCWRRRAPVVVMAVVSALGLAQCLLALLDEHAASDVAGYDIAVLVAMVTVVAHAERMWHAVVSGIVVVVGALLAFADGEEALAFAGAVVALWMTAYVLRNRQAHVVVLQERAAAVERERDHLTQLANARERGEIARELHDVVAHSLAVMVMQADGARYAIDGDREKAREALRVIGDTGRDALQDMHRIVDVLRGVAGSGEGGGDGLRKVTVADLEQMVERARSAGVEVVLRVEGDVGELAPADELTLVRIAQEGITNVLRHAGVGARAEVVLEVAGGVALLEVVDDGAGRLSPGASGSGGNGLVGVRERVSVHRGRFSAGPRVGSGWRVRVEIPLRDGAMG